jgi:hypothetical protein
VIGYTGLRRAPFVLKLPSSGKGVGNSIGFRILERLSADLYDLLFVVTSYANLFPRTAKSLDEISNLIIGCSSPLLKSAITISLFKTQQQPEGPAFSKRLGLEVEIVWQTSVEQRRKAFILGLSRH